MDAGITLAGAVLSDLPQIRPLADIVHYKIIYTNIYYKIYYRVILLSILFLCTTFRQRWNH